MKYDIDYVEIAARHSCSCPICGTEFESKMLCANAR